MFERTFFVLVLAFSAVSSFRLNREYAYEYKAQSLTGLPGTSYDFTGITLKSNIRLQVQQDGMARMRFENIKLFYTNDALESTLHMEDVDDANKLHPLPVKFADELVSSLIEPVQFKLQEGSVAELKAKATDPEWSVNLKRGFAHILTLKIKQPAVNNLQHSEQHVAKVHYKNVTEETIFGRCVVTYTIKNQREIPNPRGSPPQFLNVTKVVDIDSCVDKPIFYKSSLRALRCPNCPVFKEPIKSLTEMTYDLTGDHDKFEIEDIKVTGKHIFIPYKDIMKGSAATFIHQTAKKLRSTPIGRPIPIPRDMVQKTLIMVIPEALELGDRSPQSTASPLPLFGSTDQVSASDQSSPIPMNKVKNIINMLMRPGGKGSQKPYLILCLVKILQMANLDQLLDLARIYLVPHQHTPDAVKIGSLIMDLLPMLGTKPSFFLLSALIEQGYVKGERLAEILTAIPRTYKPDEIMLQKVKEFSQKPVILNDAKLRRTCYLAYTALISKLLAELEETPSLPSKAAAFEEKFWPELLAHWANAPTMSEKIVALKGMGNAAFIKSIPILESVIKDSKQPVVIRYQAILSLKNIAKKDPHKVEKIVLPLYLSITEVTDVRVISFLILMETFPKFETLSMIAAHLAEEKNIHVASYAYSFLKAISKTEAPDLKSYAILVQMALRQVPVIKPGIQYPKHWHKTFFYDRLDIATTLDLCTIPDEENFIPKAARLNIKMRILGNDFNVIEAGYYMEGLQTILEKLIGPHGSLITSKSAFDIFKRRARRDIVHPETEPSPQTPAPANQAAKLPHGFAYLNLFDQAIRISTWETEDFKQYLLDKRIRVCNIVDRLNQGLKLDFQNTVPLEDGLYLMPTSAGFPLKLELTAIGHVNVNKGFLKVEVVPSLFKEERSNMPPTNVKVKAELKLQMMVGFTSGMGTNLHSITSSSALRGHMMISMPVHTEINWKLIDGRIEAQYPLVKQDEDFFSMKLEPVNKVMFLNKVASHYEEKAIIIINGERQESVVKEIMHVGETLGLNLGWRVASVKSKHGEPLLVHPVEASLGISPTEQAPDMILLAIAYRRSEPSVAEEADMPGTAAKPGPIVRSLGGKKHGLLHAIRGWIGWHGGESENENHDTEIERDSEINDATTDLVQVEGSSQAVPPVAGKSTEGPVTPGSAEPGERTPGSGESDRPAAEQDFPGNPEPNTEQEETGRMLPPLLDDILPMEKAIKLVVTVHIKLINKDNPQRKKTLFAHYVLKEDLTGRLYNFQLQIIDKEYDESPVTRQICAIGYVKYPEIPLMTYKPPTNPEIRKMEAVLKLLLGSQCKDTGAVYILSLTGDKSEEQLMFENEQKYKTLPEFVQCEKDVAAGFKYSPSCLHISHMFNELFKYTIRAEYSLHTHINPGVKGMTTAAVDHLKKGLNSNNVSATSPTYIVGGTFEVAMKPPMAFIVPPAKKDKTEEQATAESGWFWGRWTDKSGDDYTLFKASLTTPESGREEFSVKRIPLALPALNLETPLLRTIFHLATNGRLPAWCKVDENRVHTFDKVSVQYPVQPGCEVIIARYCHKNLFNVMLKSVANKREKILKVHAENRMVELIPGYPTWTVKVNDQVVSVDESRPYIIRKAPQTPVASYEKKPILLTIVKIGERWLVSAPLVQAKVHFNGLEAKIQMSPFFYGRTCGLCGPFNGQIHKQFMSCDKTHLANANDMYHYYIVSSATCPAVAQKHDHQIPT